MKDLKRSIRRSHIERLKNNRKHYWGYGKPKRQVKHLVFLGIGNGWSNELISQRGLDEMSPTQISKVVKNAQSCSCLGCSGNYERRHFGRRSLKELGFIALAKTEENED